MNKMIAALTLTLAAAPFALAQAQKKAAAPKQPISFFITSEGSGKGANLGGLAGADAQCQKLAAAVGAGNRTWRAYLSTNAADGQPAVNARDRIGQGPCTTRPVSAWRRTWPTCTATRWSWRGWATSSTS